MLDLLSFLGLRYGLGAKMLVTDERFSVWTSAYGFLFDVLLFALLALEKHLRNTSNCTDLALRLQKTLKATRKKARVK